MPPVQLGHVRVREVHVVLHHLAAGVRPKRTRPYRPQTNGKAEAFIRTLLHEWA